MAFKYSVSGLTLGFSGYDFAEEPEIILEAIKHAGFDGIEMRHLSMGMSSDFELAVAEGATMLRVGTAIFGPRV